MLKMKMNREVFLEAFLSPERYLKTTTADEHTHTYTHAPFPLCVSLKKPLKHLTFHRTSSAAIVLLAFHPLAPDSPNKWPLCL